MTDHLSSPAVLRVASDRLCTRSSVLALHAGMLEEALARDGDEDARLGVQLELIHNEMAHLVALMRELRQVQELVEIKARFDRRHALR